MPRSHRTRPYAEECSGAKRLRKQQRDRERRTEVRLALQAVAVLRALLLPKDPT